MPKRKILPLVPKGGRYPSKNILPIKLMHKNCTTDRGHQTLIICEKKNPFQSGGHLKIFALAISKNLKNHFPKRVFWRNFAHISRLSIETNIWNKIVTILLWGDFIGKSNFAVRPHVLISGVHFDFFFFHQPKEAELHFRRLQKILSPKSVEVSGEIIKKNVGYPPPPPPPPWALKC